MAEDTGGRVNQVRLVGRLARGVLDRELPSGDRLLTFRLLVDRPPRAGGPRLDTVDCAAWRADLRRRLAGWAPGDVLEVEGELRRRFWRSGTVPASRYEVEVGRVRRLRRAA